MIVSRVAPGRSINHNIICQDPPVGVITAIFSSFFGSMQYTVSSS